MSEIHPQAVIDPSAQLGEGVRVGAFSVVGPGVELGEGVEIGPHCVVERDTVLGPGCVLSSHAAIGTPPQDLKYAGEPTRLVVGARNRFREFTTANRGTEGGGGLTEIGDDNLFMTGAHVAHDCKVGSNTVFANNATLAGHVEVGDGSTVGAFSAVHQFCRVGVHAFIGGYTVCTQDVLPYMRTVGGRGGVSCYGVNRIGLERKGFSAEDVKALGQVWRELRKGRAQGEETIRTLREDHAGVKEVELLLDFVEAARASRGYHG
jgi:UDP-N-acetylglucosamine acyltransferase